MRTIDVIRRMSAGFTLLEVAPPKPEDDYGTVRNPVVLWNLMIVWKDSKGYLRVLKDSAFKDKASPGSNSSTFFVPQGNLRTASTSLFLYNDANLNQVYSDGDASFLNAGSTTVYGSDCIGTFKKRIYSAGTNPQLLSEEITGRFDTKKGEYSGYYIDWAFTKFGQILEVRRDVTGKIDGTPWDGDRGDFPGKNFPFLTPTPRATTFEIDIPSVINMRILRNFSPGYMQVVQTTINGRTINWPAAENGTAYSYFDTNGTDVRTGSSTSFDRRIRLVGRNLTQGEILNSKKIIDPNGNIVPRSQQAVDTGYS